MRLLHTADLHLDSAFCAYGARDAEAQREEGRALLRRIFECAVSEGCQLILIAGDLFDSKFVSPESERLFCSLVEGCGIPVVIAPGNHDPYVEGGFYARAMQKLSDKLAVFNSPELQILELEELGARVCGYAFTSQALTVSPLANVDIPKSDGVISLFCGHADLNNPGSRYAPVTLAELERCGFAYAALGHVHNVKEQEDDRGRIRYSGFAQGRAFDELGQGGVWIVDTDGESTECQRVYLAEKAFYISELALGAEDGAEEAKQKLIEAVNESGLGSGAYLRMTLTGMADSETVAYLTGAETSLARELGIAYLEIIDGTLPLLDGEYLERDTSLKGELYRTLRPKLISADAAERELALKALRIGLAAIDGKSILGLYR